MGGGASKNKNEKARAQTESANEEYGSEESSIHHETDPEAMAQAVAANISSPNRNKTSNKAD